MIQIFANNYIMEGFILILSLLDYIVKPTVVSGSGYASRGFDQSSLIHHPIYC